MRLTGAFLFKNAWYSLHFPHHLYHYTLQTLGTILELSGCKMTCVLHQIFLYNFMASMGYSLEDRGYKN
jgi:hypothetical protein